MADNFRKNTNSNLPPFPTTMDCENVNSPIMKIILINQIWLNMAAILSNTCFLLEKNKMAMFHRNTRIILNSSVIINLAHSLVGVALQGYILFIYFTMGGCEIQIASWMCFGSRSTLMGLSLAYVPVNVALVVERVVASLKPRTYYKKSFFFGTVLVLLAVGLWMKLISSAGVTGSIMKDYSLDSHYTYCSGVTRTTATGVTLACYGMTLAEIVAIFVFVSLWKLNKHNRADIKEKNYSIDALCQIEENFSSISVFAPWVGIHCAFFLVYYMTNALIGMIGPDDELSKRACYAAAYIILPLYALISPSLLRKISAHRKKYKLTKGEEMAKAPWDGPAYQRYLADQWKANGTAIEG